MYIPAHRSRPFRVHLPALTKVILRKTRETISGKISEQNTIGGQRVSQQPCERQGGSPVESNSCHFPLGEWTFEGSDHPPYRPEGWVSGVYADKTHCIRRGTASKQAEAASAHTVLLRCH